MTFWWGPLPSAAELQVDLNVVVCSVIVVPPVAVVVAVVVVVIIVENVTRNSVWSSIMASLIDSFNCWCPLYKRKIITTPAETTRYSVQLGRNRNNFGKNDWKQPRFKWDVILFWVCNNTNYVIPRENLWQNIFQGNVIRWVYSWEPYSPRYSTNWSYPFVLPNAIKVRSDWVFLISV